MRSTAPNSKSPPDDTMLDRGNTRAHTIWRQDEESEHTGLTAPSDRSPPGWTILIVSRLPRARPLRNDLPFVRLRLSDAPPTPLPLSLLRPLPRPEARLGDFDRLLCKAHQLLDQCAKPEWVELASNVCPVKLMHFR